MATTRERPLGRARRGAQLVAQRAAELDATWWILAGMVACWVVVFGVLVFERHDRFGSFGFDMGIFDQAVWLLSRFGGQFITVRGLPVFGHHANMAFYLLVPFYWLGAGPHFLNLLQVLSMALGAVPVFLLARHRFGYGWVALPLAAAYLLHPSLQFMAWELFHPDAMAITPLLFAYWFAVRERWGWFAVCAVLAVAWKEDVALAVLVLGVILFLRGYRRQGGLAAGLSLAWFLFVTRVMLPAFNHSHAFYLSFFSDLGSSPLEMAKNSVRHPTLVTRRLAAPDAQSYLWKMTAPFAFVPLLAPSLLLVGVPQVLVNLLSVNDFTRKITFHYAALPLAALTLATIEGIARVTDRPGGRRFLVGLVAAGALAGTALWGPSPIGAEFKKGWWPAAGDQRRAAKEAALAMVPRDAAVSTTYQFVAHLSHRKRVYEFPNPFVPKNWGVADENYPSAQVAKWLVIDTALTGADDRKVLDEAISSGQFQKLYERDGIVVARRVGASD